MAGHPVDVHVGTRVRQRRTLLGMSQTTLAKALGLSFQQIQKNETGANRLSSSRLYEVSNILDVPVSYFFEEMPVNALVGPRRGRRRAAVLASIDELDPLAKRETLELVRAYYKVADPRVRKRVFEMVKALGGTHRVRRAARKVPTSRFSTS